MSHNSDKFLFDRDLLLEIAQEQKTRELQSQQAAKPAEPTFTQSEHNTQIDAAKQEAFEQGKQQGIEEGKAAAHDEFQAEFNEKVQPIIQKLSNQENDYNKLIGHAQESALILVQEMLKRLFPKIVDNFRIELTEEAIHKALTQTFSAIHIRLRVNPQSIEWVQEKIDINAPLFNGKEVELIPDSQIPIGDCISEWDSAGVRVCLKDALDQINHILEAAVGNAHTPPTEEMLEHLKTLDQARQTHGHQETKEQPIEPVIAEQGESLNTPETVEEPQQQEEVEHAEERATEQTESDRDSIN